MEDCVKYHPHNCTLGSTWQHYIVSVQTPVSTNVLHEMRPAVESVELSVEMPMRSTAFRARTCRRAPPFTAVRGTALREENGGGGVPVVRRWIAPKREEDVPVVGVCHGFGWLRIGLVPWDGSVFFGTRGSPTRDCWLRWSSMERVTSVGQRVTALRLGANMAMCSTSGTPKDLSHRNGVAETVKRPFQNGPPQYVLSESCCWLRARPFGFLELLLRPP